MKLISYIFPIYNEEENIPLLVKTLNKVTGALSSKYDIEYIFINDGSKDGSLNKLLNEREKDSRIKIINFSRNFGHQWAITAGIDYAQGDALIIMDSDMQDPPSVSLDLISRWEEGYDVVYAQRRTRKDTFFKKTTAHMFYRILNYLANINIPADTGDFRLIDKKVAETIRKFREANRFMRGMVSYVGYKQIAVVFDRDERHAGSTNYPLKKMIRLALDGITSFSTVPLKLISQLGLAVSFVSFLGIIYALYMKIFVPSITVSGWTLMIICILFIGGIQLIMLGILGMYIGRIYTEVQNRPLYIISEIFESKES